METLDTEKQATRARFMPPLRGLDNRADDGFYKHAAPNGTLGSSMLFQRKQRRTRIWPMEPMLKPYMKYDGLSILVPVSFGRMQQTY